MLKQDVEDSSEAIQEFLDSGGDTKPSEYLKSKALTDEESESIEGEITLTEINHEYFKKMNGSSAPGIDGNTISTWGTASFHFLEQLMIEFSKGDFSFNAFTFFIC